MNRALPSLALLAVALAGSAHAECGGGPGDAPARLLADVQAATASAPVLQVEHMTSAVVAPLIRAELARRGYRGGRVLVRSFYRGRLPEILATGTDRGPTSAVFNVPRWDSDDATRAAHGITPDRMTFLVDVDLGRPGAPISYGPDASLPHDHTLAAFFGETGLGGLKKTTDDFAHPALAVYARDGLLRAPVGEKPRQAGAEFWFKGDPRESLLMVIEK